MISSSVPPTLLDHANLANHFSVPVSEIDKDKSRFNLAATYAELDESHTGFDLEWLKVEVSLKSSPNDQETMYINLGKAFRLKTLSLIEKNEYIFK